MSSRTTAICALVALVLPAFARAQQAPANSPTIPLKVIGRMPRNGYVADASPSPSGKLIAYTIMDEPPEVGVFNVATGRTTVLKTGGSIGIIRWSPAGDRIFFDRWNDAARTSYLWAIPVDPKTGVATGEQRRVTTIGGAWPTASPDGKLVAFVANYATADARSLAVVPATGGEERILVRGDIGSQIGWSPDGKSIYYHLNKRAVNGWSA